MRNVSGVAKAVDNVELTGPRRGHNSRSVRRTSMFRMLRGYPPRRMLTLYALWDEWGHVRAVLGSVNLRAGMSSDISCVHLLAMRQCGDEESIFCRLELKLFHLISLVLYWMQAILPDRRDLTRITCTFCPFVYPQPIWGQICPVPAPPRSLPPSLPFSVAATYRSL